MGGPPPKTYSQAAQRLVSPQGLLPTPPPPTNTQLSTSPPLDTASILREMQHLRQTIVQLRQENERLARENAALKQHISSQPPTPPPTTTNPDPPPVKRKATESPQTENEELREEIHTLLTAHRTNTQDQISSLQTSMQELHKEVLQWMRTITPQVPTSTSLTVDPAQIPISIDHDQDL